MCPRCMMHDAWCMMYDAWCMMHDVWCMMHDDDAWCMKMMHGAWCIMHDNDAWGEVNQAITSLVVWTKIACFEICVETNDPDTDFKMVCG